MAREFKDRVQDTTQTIGTGNFVLDTAMFAGYRTFGAAHTIGATLEYFVSVGSDWEAGVGTLVTATQLARTTVNASSNGGSLVSFGVGSKVIFETVGGATLAALAAATAYKPPVSQYDRALIFSPPPRQTNAVKGFSRNINDAQYVGAITDQDVYDCEAGALTVGMSYSGGTPTNTSSKALQFPWGKMLWDLGAGESLLIQMRVKTVASVATANLCGNYNATDGGFSIGLYDATNATTPGFPYFNYKAQGTAAQSINIPAALVGASAVTTPPLPTDVYFNLTVHVDGASRMLTAYINGQPHVNAGVSQLNTGSTLQTVNHNFGLGHVPVDDTYTTSLAKAVRFQAFRMAVLPAGLQFANVGMLDWHFNNNPRVLFSDASYLGGA